MAYILDADVFIRAKNLHYGFDFCPASLLSKTDRFLKIVVDIFELTALI